MGKDARKRGTSPFSQKKDGDSGQDEDLKIAEQSREPRSDIHDAFVPEKQIEGKGQAAEGNEEKLPGWWRFVQVFFSNRKGQKKKETEKYPVKCRAGWHHIGELDENR